MTTFTNKAQEQVKEFHEAFNHPVSDKPTSLTLERTLNRCIWNGEELLEQLKAVSTNQDEFRNAFAQLLVGLKKAFQKESDKPFLTTVEEQIIAQADAITDRLYFTMGDATELGVNLQPIMDIVHEANMSKLFTNEETGEKYAKYGDDGKVIKSPDFWSPEGKIAEEIKRQLEGNVNSYEPSDKAKLEGITVEEKPKRKTTPRKKKEVVKISDETINKLREINDKIEKSESLNEELELQKDKLDIIQNSIEE